MRSRWSERMKRMNSTLPCLGQPAGSARVRVGTLGASGWASSGTRPLVRCRVLGVVEALERAGALAEMLKPVKRSWRKKRLSNVSLKCSIVPLRHGSRVGMKTGVMRWCRQTRTTSPGVGETNGPPLSNWMRWGTPWRPTGHAAPPRPADRHGR